MGWQWAVIVCYCYWWVMLLESTWGPGCFHSLCPVPQVRLWACLFLHGGALSGHASSRQPAGPDHWRHHWLDLLDLCHVYQHLPKAAAVSRCLLTSTRLRKGLLHPDFLPVVSILWNGFYIKHSWKVFRNQSCQSHVWLFPLLSLTTSVPAQLC